MDPHPSTSQDDAVRAFVEQMLRTGLMLTDLLSGLLEEVSPDAFPGEQLSDVLLEMLAGTIRPAADAAGPVSVQQATALLGAVADRTVTDLRAALGSKQTGGP